eukprot:TRINITY_DN13346_c0_g1_i1.p1 TRINITY_DN13346_c0_g1~~TRINITY_DN13346_c0_g1_i1.p1  ORF type:complete len:144 (-),score=28.19 TRINITY_DN13346_c0_g1_i1:103-534(-)
MSGNIKNLHMNTQLKIVRKRKLIEDFDNVGTKYAFYKRNTVTLNNNTSEKSFIQDQDPVNEVRGVVVYKEKVEKENAIGEIIIFKNTTIMQVKELICNELGQELPFDLKRCHVPIPETQYHKLAFLYFSERVGDNIVIIPPKD